MTDHADRKLREAHAQICEAVADELLDEPQLAALECAHRIRSRHEPDSEGA
jgi:hypothetical protein